MLTVLMLISGIEGNIGQIYVKGLDTSQVGFVYHSSYLHRPNKTFQDILDETK